MITDHCTRTNGVHPRLRVGLVLLGFSFLLASCARQPELKEDTPSAKEIVEAPAKKETPAKADPREITFHVDGMAERLKLI